MDVTNTTTTSSSSTSSESIPAWVSQVSASLGTIIPILTLLFSFIHRKILITTCFGKKFTVKVEDIESEKADKADSKDSPDKPEKPEKVEIITMTPSKVSEQTNKTMEILNGLREKKQEAIPQEYIKPIPVPTFKKFTLMFSSRKL